VERKRRVENGLKNLEVVVVRKWRWWVRDRDIGFTIVEEKKFKDFSEGSAVGCVNY
jgi:hypothetical protein